ncbi:MAG: hypothetical protein Q4F30_00985 [Akkermansia sp.]|nr:hypothetical protein [Akkermansia sp.]
MNELQSLVPGLGTTAGRGIPYGGYVPLHTVRSEDGAASLRTGERFIHALVQAEGDRRTEEKENNFHTAAILASKRAEVKKIRLTCAHWRLARLARKNKLISKTDKKQNKNPFLARRVDEGRLQGGMNHQIRTCIP